MAIDWEAVKKKLAGKAAESSGMSAQAGRDIVAYNQKQADEIAKQTGDDSAASDELLKKKKKDE
jgi:hypothetical protein